MLAEPLTFDTDSTPLAGIRPAVEIAGESLRVHFSQFNLPTYSLFLSLKKLPESSITFDDSTETYTVTAPRRFARILGIDPGQSGLPSAPLLPALFDDQRAIVNLALDAKRFACWSDCGLGKGLLPDCPVLTPSGFSPLKSIRVGDSVIGSSGFPTRVAGVFPRGVQSLFRVTFSDGVSVVCDADHLWNVKSYNDAARDKPWRTISTRELAATKLKYGTHGQSRTWQIPMVGTVQHPTGYLPLDPYVLGVLLGDGSTSNGTVSWSKPDESVANRVSASLPVGCEVSRVDGGSRRCTTWRIVAGKGRANPVTDRLRSMGLMGLKSSAKFVPPEYLTADAESRISLLQGLMDTDGYAGESPEFCSTSERLADAVIQLVESLGGTASKGVKAEPQYVHKGERRTGQTAYRVVMTLPAGINPFWLARKANAYKPASRGLGRWIDSIEPCGEGETICIKVDAEDGLFVIDRYIVTHNTLVQLEFARQVHIRTGGRVLLVTLNDIVQQTIEEAQRFYGDSLPIRRLNSRWEMKRWCKGDIHADHAAAVAAAAENPGGPDASPIPGPPIPSIAITNYEKFNPDKNEGQTINELRHLAGVVLDESSRLKTGGGKQKWALIKSTKGVEYKLSCTATPAPNDTMEFASQASFLERMRSEGEIIWTYFQRNPKTQKWQVRRHAREAFFRFMATWSIYVRDPRKYGWRLDHQSIPEPIVTLHEIEPTPEQISEQRAFQREKTGQLLMFDSNAGGVSERTKLSEVAKGFLYEGAADSKGKKRARPIPSRKPGFVADLVAAERAEGLQVLVWTQFDAESSILATELSRRGIAFDLVTGSVAKKDRQPILERFRRGESPVLIGRPKMLGYGQNFQRCGSMIFSGWNDSFEEWYQAIRRAFRYGQTQRLRVHVPIIRELEGDMLENVFQKEEKHLAAIDDMERCYIASLREMGLLQ